MERSHPGLAPAGDRVERIVNELSCAPQGSAAQRQAERHLLEQIFGAVEHLCRRRYLPDDESAQAALQVVERLRRNNYHNLRAFLRWSSVGARLGVCAAKNEHERPARTFDVWLRRLCRWEARRRLQRYVRGPWFEAIDASSLPDRRVTFADEALIERELMGLEAHRLDLAYAALTKRQREALRLYALGRGRPVAPGERHAQTRRHYELIANALVLPSADEAREFVRVARQRLRRILQRLCSSPLTSAPGRHDALRPEREAALSG